MAPSGGTVECHRHVIPLALNDGIVPVRRNSGNKGSVADARKIKELQYQDPGTSNAVSVDAELKRAVGGFILSTDEIERHVATIKCGWVEVHADHRLVRKGARHRIVVSHECVVAGIGGQRPRSQVITRSRGGAPDRAKAGIGGISERGGTAAPGPTPCR